jgi:RNA polymerase sigma factor (sigma-70 family)
MNQQEYRSDADYVSAIRKGGRAGEHAVDGLYRHYRDTTLTKIRSYLRFKSGIEDDALDMAQDAFLIMIEKIRDGGYNEGSLLHFWIGITRGLLRNKHKRDARTDLTDDSQQYDNIDFESPENILLQDERREVLDQVLSRLGDRCKKVLLMWAGGYSMEEIAETLGLSSEAMARKTKYKCKNQLMELMNDINLDL